MSATAGAAFARPFCGADRVKALLQTAASSTSTSCSSGGSLGRKGTTPSSRSPWPPYRLGIPAVRNKLDSFGFLGQQDGIGPLVEVFKYSQRAPEQLICPSLTLRSRVREGGADSESKGSNHSSESRKSTSQKEPSLLLSLVQEIQPLDVNQIGKEVSPDSTDAMKRTISGMLGLLPSDQFNVTIETSGEPLAKLFVSSMMTGYTLRNAEYRLCLQKSLEFSGDDVGGENKKSEDNEMPFEGVQGTCESSGHEEEDRNLASGVAIADARHESAIEDGFDKFQSLGYMNEEAKQYIQYLKQKVALVKKELEDCKRINTGLQVQSIVGEEKNDLLDYLRSLPPDKVSELSQPTSSEVADVIQHIINQLLESPLTKLQHKSCQCGNGTANTFKGSWEEEGTQMFSASPLQSQSTVSVNRDHLARLLFWCMLLGHHVRALEYRLELSRTLSLSGELDTGVTERNQDG